jgi:Zn-finger nucleic acid-binding protein
MSERQGIEIDYCPQCRGVWLDRGELDKIIERSEAAAPAPQASAPGAPAGGWTPPVHTAPPQQQPWAGGHRGRDDDDDRHRYSHAQGHGYGGKRKKSWLGELFD